MAVDSRDRRASLLGMNLPAPRLLPNPEGSLANRGDHFQLAQFYRIREDATGVAPGTFESRIGLTTTASEAIEAVAALVRQAQSAVEALQAEVSSGIAAVEFRAAAGPGVADAQTEWATTVGPVEATIQLASKGQVANAAAEAVETMSAPAATGPTGLESNQLADVATAELQLESLLGVDGPVVLPIEWTRALVLVSQMAEPPFEALQRRYGSSIMLVEAKRRLPSTAVVNWGSFYPVSANGVVQLESRRRLSSPGSFQLESAIRKTQQALTGLESLSMLRRGLALPAEWVHLTSSFIDVVQTGVVNIDVVRLLKISPEVPVEWKELLSVPAIIPLDRLRRMVPAGVEAFEAEGAVAITALVPVEYLLAGGPGVAQAVLEALMALEEAGSLPWSHSADQQPADHVRISGRGTLTVDRQLSGILVVARGATGG